MGNLTFRHPLSLHRNLLKFDKCWDLWHFVIIFVNLISEDNVEGYFPLPNIEQNSEWMQWTAILQQTLKKGNEINGD